MQAPAKKHFLTPGGRLDVEIVSNRVLTTRMSGRLDLKLAEHLLQCLDAWVSLGGSRLLAFHDWRDVEDYDSSARELLTPWSKTHRPKFDGVHILVQSRVLAWGIQLVNGLTGDVMTAHHTRESFDESRRAIP